MASTEQGALPMADGEGRFVGDEFVAPEAAGNRAFEVEQHGIDHIPDNDRRGRPFDLFWIWFGANVIFTYVIDGAIIVGFGLGFWAALAVILVGNVFYVLVGLCSVPGARAGTATLVVSRSAFGVLGNAPAAFLSWLTAVGWEAVNIVIGALSLYEIFQELGADGGTTWKVVALAAIVVLTFGVAVLGHATITLLNKVFSYLLGIGTLALGILVLPKIDLHAHPALAAPSHTGAWLLALVVMAAAPFSWVNTGADYSRYLPRRTSARQITLWTTLGGAIPAVIITVFGAAAATATDMSDPVAGLKAILPNWFFVVYLAVIVGGTITNNFLNTYSSGMSLLALGLKAKRWQAVLVDSVIGTALSAYALFVFDFTNSFTSFLSLMVLWIAPWCGIYLADMALRRGHYDVVALHSRGGRYWYRRGFNPVALGWFAAGIVLAALFASSAIYSGPLTGLVGGGDISIFVGFVVTLAGYYLTMRRRVGQADGSELVGAPAAADASAALPAPRTSVASTDETTMP
ncbi:MAG: cytosine or purine or uracil or thiamine or allantoin permease [Streptosporangiaceae bacterium]|nr:cytosine or purine or uracil or thiamine or allantoin permease [Streptosporangiaceae bacterium]